MSNKGLYAWDSGTGRWILIYGQTDTAVTPPPMLFPSATLRPATTLYPEGS